MAPPCDRREPKAARRAGRTKKGPVLRAGGKRTTALGLEAAKRSPGPGTSKIGAIQNEWGVDPLVRMRS